jgi:hypothetical protein
MSFDIVTLPMGTQLLKEISDRLAHHTQSVALKVRERAML